MPDAPARTFAKPPAAPATDPKELKRKEKLGPTSRPSSTSACSTSSNLSALEKASDKELRTEIDAIASEALEEMSIVLNRDERMRLGQELLDEVKGLGPLEPLLRRRRRERHPS